MATKKTDSKTIDVATQTLSHDGITREYILYLPNSYDGETAVPLMLNFHGFGMTASEQLAWADMRSVADAENFVLVYPQGTLLDGFPHWNAGLDTEENKSDADDFGFVETLIDEISAQHNIDLERVYATGYSNGAFFAYSLACFQSDKIAAIGSVAGTMLTETYQQCSPLHPTAMINIHGTADDVVPYAGGEGLTPIEDVLAYWADFNQTTASPTINRVEEKGISIEHYVFSGGENETSVEHYKIIDGGHIWFEISYDGSDTNHLIWDFVSRYDINGLR
ncbi:MAG: PHB depolymerase family esterase [Chloroflexota bacterium]